MGIFTDMAKLCDYFDGAALRYAESNIQRVTGEDGKEYIRFNMPQRFTVSDASQIDQSYQFKPLPVGYPNGCPILPEGDE